MIGIQNFALPIIIDNKFLSAIDYIPLLGLGVVFMSLSSVLGIIYQCVKKNINAFKTSLLSGVVIVILGFFIIPKYNLLGASLVFTIGNFIWLLYRIIDIQQFVKLKIPVFSFIGYIAIGFIIWGISLFGTFTVFIISFVFASIVSVILNKHFILKYCLVIYLKLKH